VGNAPVRFGYGFDIRNPQEWSRPWPDIYAEHLDFIAWTDTLGFEGVWLAEHHARDDGYLPSPLMFGAAVAARTKKMRICTSVALAPHYHPVRLAEDMAVLDLISNGRADLALGLGYLDDEARGYGFHPKKRARMTNEILEIVRRLWEGESVTWTSEFFTLENARVTPLPVQKPSIPLYVGASTQAGLRRAAVYGDGYIGGISEYGNYLAEVRACGKDEREARLLSMDDMWLVVSEDPEKTIQEVAPHFYYQLNTYAQWQADKDWRPHDAIDFETFRTSGRFKVLTPAETIAQYKAKLDVAPAEGFCMFAPSGYPLAKLAESAELFANKVLPAFR
jgi:alkanesulfonate monooxygenase SsuD/methylene tetrahydromethanopterin reductase-like flavin-dependent oxidoreductase (luciferase family)